MNDVQTHDAGRKPIATGHLSDSGDLIKKYKQRKLVHRQKSGWR